MCWNHKLEIQEIQPQRAKKEWDIVFGKAVAEGAMVLNRLESRSKVLQRVTMAQGAMSPFASHAHDFVQCMFPENRRNND